MSTMNFAGPSPYDPYSRAKLGWIDPIKVTDSLSDQVIAGYMSNGSGQAYELMHNPQEYFLVSNHKLNPPFASPWEQGFPGKGLLIWHIDTTGDIHHVDHKLVDVETADGLWDSVLTEHPMRNDSTGQDSIDADTANIGYYWCFFNNTTKQAFNDTSNPTTDGYVRYDTTNGKKWKQTVPTGIAVNNIQGAGGGTMRADFIDPNPNMWWGPDTVHITGDFVVGQGNKLGILPGTVVKFSTTDDQHGGSDNSKCELIVQGTLEARGTESDSIHFLSASSTPSDSDWYGIEVVPGGRARFNYCDFRNAYMAISDGGGAHDSITNCRFRNNLVHAVKTGNNSLLIDNCIIENDSIGGSNQTCGILCSLSSPTIKNTLIKNCQYGVKATTSTRFLQKPVIEECGFYNIGQIGIWAASSSAPTIKKCCFKGSVGTTCIQVDGGNPYIEKCYMASQGAGITIGMVFTGKATGKIKQTTIWDYDSCAVEIAPIGSYNPNPNFGTYDSAGNNWFERTDCCNYFISTSSCTVKAEWNYWETEDHDSIDAKISGNVDFDSVLGVCFRPIPYYPNICSNLPPSDPSIPLCKIAGTSEEEVSKSFAVSQNYPNPFNPQTVIKYDLPEPEHVRIVIYNILGQKVRALVDEDQEAGEKSVNWDGKDDLGKEVATGIYFYHIKAGDFSMVKKMVLLK
jgi:hypothetical protein